MRTAGLPEVGGARGAVRSVKGGRHGGTGGGSGAGGGRAGGGSSEGVGSKGSRAKHAFVVSFPPALATQCVGFASWTGEAKGKDVSWLSSRCQARASRHGADREESLTPALPPAALGLAGAHTPAGPPVRHALLVSSSSSSSSSGGRVLGVRARQGRRAAGHGQRRRMGR